MAKEVCDNSIIPLEFDIFIGLDVDKKSAAVTVLDHEGKLHSLKMPNNALALINYAEGHFPEKRVVFAYESGITGYGLHDGLKDAGYKCLVVNPSSVPLASSSRVKTNRIDSERIAKGIRGGQLKGIRIPSPKYRNLRHLIRLRDITTQRSQACKCRIKAMLLLEGIPFPDAETENHWSNNIIEKLKVIPCDEPIRFKLEMFLEDLCFTREQLLKIKKEIRDFCKADPDLSDSLKYLMSLPGIGWAVAPALLARIGDWRNLENANELAGFIGLTPCERSTGEDVNKGNITRLGDSKLRSMLIEGAWVAIRKDAELKGFFNKIYSRHPHDRASRKAIVAVARKMTTRIYSVLKNRRPYFIKDEYGLSCEKRGSAAPEDDSTHSRTLNGSHDKIETSG